jgi:hypothetical protein
MTTPTVTSTPTTLKFKISRSGGSIPTHEAYDEATNGEYTIEEFGDGKNRFHLSFVDYNEINERGNCPVEQVGRFFSLIDAAREAIAHLDGIRNEADKDDRR